MYDLTKTHRFFVSPDGMKGQWLHPLDLSTGMYPQYASWVDCTNMDDHEFEKFVASRQLMDKR